jgi:hypothetical protein
MTTKQNIVEAIEELSEQHLADVLQYIQQLANIQKSPTTKPLTPISDPLADFIGAVSHGSLATNLDNELYDD